MAVIDRYLLRETLLHWLAVALVLWAVLMSNQLARYLGDAAAGELPGGVIFVLLGLKSVAFAAVLLPFSFYLGILLGLGRLYKDSEMTALGACGVGLARQYRPLLGLALLVAAVAAWLSLVAAPRAAALGYEVRARAERVASVGMVNPGRFQSLGPGGLVVYAQSVDREAGQIRNLFVQGRQEGRGGLLTARRAHTERDPDSGARVLIMEDGYRYQGFPGDADYRVMAFDRHGIRLGEPAPVEAAMKHDAVPTAALIDSVDPEDRAELQWRLVVPLSAVALAVLAVPLARTSPRQGHYGRLVTAVLVLIVYYNLLGTAQVWVESAAIGGVPGMWWVLALPPALAAALTRGARRRRRARREAAA